MAQQHQQQQRQQTGIDALIQMVADLGRKQETFQNQTTRKLDEFRADWDDWREQMPTNYTPRRETDQALVDLRRTDGDHETRLRAIEAQIAAAPVTAIREAQGVERRADATHALDMRTIQNYLVTALLMLLSGVITYLVAHPH